jgi:hypothetical protein
VVSLPTFARGLLYGKGGKHPRGIRTYNHATVRSRGSASERRVDLKANILFSVALQDRLKDEKIYVGHLDEISRGLFGYKDVQPRDRKKPRVRE